MNAALRAALGAAVRWSPQEALRVGPRQLEPSRRHASDLLQMEVGVAVHDAGELRRSLDRGCDPLLYCAYRDVLPPRIVPCRDRDVVWHTDLVAYEGGILPTGEPHRSVGHWNLDDEWELFQVVAGEVLMLAAARGGASMTAWRCREGDVLVLSPGSWHATYVQEGRPLVLNVYSVATEASAPLHDERVKYARRTRRSPPLVAVCGRDGLVLLDQRTGRERPLRGAQRPGGPVADALRMGPGRGWLGAFLTHADDETCARALPAVPMAA